MVEVEVGFSAEVVDVIDNDDDSMSLRLALRDESVQCSKPTRHPGRRRCPTTTGAVDTKR